MAYVPRSAKFAQVRVNGANAFAVRGWSVDIPCSEIDVTSTEDNGQAHYLASYIEARIKIEFMHNSAANPYDAPFSFLSGNSITNLILYLNTPANAFWLFPTAIVLNTPMDAQVRDALKGSMELRPTSPWTAPTGAF